MSSRRRLLRDSSSCPGASLSPVRPLLALRSFCRLRGSPRRTQGLRGRALGSSAPAGWLCLGQLSRARRADRARRPAGSAGAAREQAPPCTEQASECARGSLPPARPPAPAPFPPPSSPFPPPPPAAAAAAAASPHPPAGPLLCWFHCAVARPAPASSRGRLDTLSL